MCLNPRSAIQSHPSHKASVYLDSCTIVASEALPPKPSDMKLMVPSRVVEIEIFYMLSFL